MSRNGRSLARRIDSLRIRIDTLSSLRKLVDLPPESDIAERQWSVITSELNLVEARLLSRLKKVAREHLPHANDLGARRQLNGLLGALELQLSNTFTFFDTYMDVLTQRHTRELGGLLAGCDVLAWDGISKDHPALAIVERPLVYCDRGFGASTLREGVRLPGRAFNPIPLIQIPYSRLKEKYNLTSILHEVGHEAMVRLGLVKTLPHAFRSALAKAGAPATMSDLFALWSSEIGPDFWTFCASGIAEAGAIREILALPPNHCFKVSWTDPHPPPYLRVLLSFEWCRQVWGSGLWNEWEKEWLELYPLERAPAESLEIIKRAKQYLPLVSRVLLHGRFRALSGKAIPDLFNLAALAPSELQRIARSAESGALNLTGLPPSAHLAVFRLLREQGRLKEESIDATMTKWLLRLGKKRQGRH
ncbi:MAG: hypothetical protein HY695_08390 [Deltaproteobacteria bacterium]|nr:hypothetical protein [Deltaproteobacteria bacterium]